MSIHIALMGKTREPVLKGYQHYGGIEKLYLLHSANNKEFAFKDLALDVKKRFEEIGFKGTLLKEVNAFDMDSIVNAIVSIARAEKPPFYVNITGGTNLMAGAACAASFFIGAKAYYVRGKVGDELSKSRVIELPVPNIPFQIPDETQLGILKILSKQNGSVSNTLIRQELGLSPQILSYHIKEMVKKGLVEYDQNKNFDRRRVYISATNAGRLVLRWGEDR